MSEDQQLLEEMRAADRQRGQITSSSPMHSTIRVPHHLSPRG
ncbi:hypothetical protein ACH4SK_18120 [Streptomyces inhibens]